MIGDMSAGQRIDPPEEKADPLPNRRYRQTWPFGRAAAAGVTPVGLRPPFVTPAAAHSHPDRRWILTLIVAPHELSLTVYRRQFNNLESSFCSLIYRAIPEPEGCAQRGHVQRFILAN